MKLSEKLITLRKEKGWSQEDFAEKLDVSRQAISRWENGSAQPDAQNILRISKLFDVSADYLLNDDCERERDVLGIIATDEESAPPAQKKKIPYGWLISAACFVILAACAAVYIVKVTDKAHFGHALDSVKENEVSPTCAAGGSYYEVIYCVKCKGEILRTKKEEEKLEHRFEDRICLACGEAQPSEGLVYMSNGNGTCTVDIGDCTDENIVIPPYSPDGDQVVQIKAYAFSGRNNIKSVQIPETVTRIGEGVFKDCMNLESVNLPKKLTMILSYTFDGCKNLKEITIPSGVTYIGEEAFADCVSMERITIPAGVTKIGRFAFSNFSRCKGTVTFEVYEGWGLYDDSGSLVHMVDFANGHFSPCLYITFAYSEYSWRRN